MKEEKKKNNEKEEPTYYVDRDRAAAIVVGSKDIKSELKVGNSSSLQGWIQTTTILQIDIEFYVNIKLAKYHIDEI